MLSRDDALADVETVIRTLERAHADPYRFRSRDVLDAERRRIIDTMPASLTTIELCLRLSRLVATLEDGHTAIPCEQLIIHEWRVAAKAAPPETQTVRMFQPYMRLDDQQHLTVGWPNDAPGVQPGDRLLRVNGLDADALLSTWTRDVSNDTEAGRRAWIARTFRLQLALRGISAPYRITVAAPGAAERDVVVAGEPVN